MACPEFEDLILDYCEGASSPADSALLEAHIAACLPCREYLSQQQELDLRLTKSLPRPSLSPAFAGNLAARIAVEHRAPRFRRVARVLDTIGYLSLATAGGFLIEQLPHAGQWIGQVVVVSSAAFCLWQMAKALRTTYGHR
jgi:anti-sigma factor RsiW